MTTNNNQELYYTNNSNGITFSVFYKKIPLRRVYVYERGVEEFDDVILVTIEKNGVTGRGECSPFPSFFNHTIESVLKDVVEAETFVFKGVNPSNLVSLMASGPARNAIDSALLDLICKQKKISIWELLKQLPPKLTYMYHTIELDTFEKIESRLQELSGKTEKLKLKLGSTQDDEKRLKLVRKVIPNATIIIDVNEGWDISYLKKIMPILEYYKVKMIEQPLPHNNDDGLLNYTSPIPIYADESFHDLKDLQAMNTSYDGVNVKLDKVGGLTNALFIIQQAKKYNLGIMVGCLGGTSLSSAAGYVAAQHATFIDLDTHLWLKTDIENGLGGLAGHMATPSADLWG